MRSQVTSLRRSSLAVASGVVALDQITKHWAVSQLNDGHVVNVLGSLRLNLSFNNGMAFSQGTGIGPIIGVLGMIVVVFLLAGMRRSSVSGAVFVGLVAGGAAGNIVDRLFRGDAWLHGAVVDFIDLQWWPVFNIADAAICIGGALLVFTSFRTEKS
ncbi:MAG: signal peptidase II [Actinobacteria bacterium]|nr:signal peptidase II [Actinomycetota bacterium]MTH93843.1 signal peptidase II [Actinomycetota bacterium]NDG65332.1 signal peptidase II [Actinomycetota bacterium]